MMQKLTSWRDINATFAPRLTNIRIAYFQLQALCVSLNQDHGKGHRKDQEKARHLNTPLSINITPSSSSSSFADLFSTIGSFLSRVSKMGSDPPSPCSSPDGGRSTVDAYTISSDAVIGRPYLKGVMMPWTAVISLSLFFIVGALFYNQSTFLNKEINVLSFTSTSSSPPANATNPSPPPPPPNPNVMTPVPSLSRKTGGRPLPRSPFFCPSLNKTVSCTAPSHKDVTIDNVSPPSSCPEYFRWIYEDLRPWKMTGVTREMVERAGRTANFRILILKGRLYVESYSRCFQTRDTSGWWGLVQFVKRFANRLPDLDLMFDCDDMPVIRARDFSPNRGKPSPPPLFRYCKDGWTLDIPFPDWSFWGWPDINIKPWVPLLKDFKEASGKKGWVDREPYAYWKGNTGVSRERKDLMQCNAAGGKDWSVRAFAQNWGRESRQGFRNSNLADQCAYRYKVYVEGRSWSVSQKYIMACDSVVLRVSPRYDEFFTRGLFPLQHYWPIRTRDKCPAIKFAVQWGNANQDKAQAIGRSGSKFIMEELKMDYVYDYMFHLLTEYAKLLKFKPEIPLNAVEVCEESLTCFAEGREREFTVSSTVDVSGPPPRPCSLPPPYSDEEMSSLLQRKEEAMRQVESWEREWREHNSTL